MTDIIGITSEQLDSLTLLMHEKGINLKQALVLYNSNTRANENALHDLQNMDTKRMSKTELIEATWKLPEMDQYLYELLSEQGGFMTGSNVTSDIDDPKDEDWCVQIAPSAFSLYSLGQSDHGYWEADGFSTVYCHYQGKLVNIICFSDTQLFEAWYVATEIMRGIKDHFVPRPPNTYYGNAPTTTSMSDIFATKWKRVILFRALKDIAYEPARKREMDNDDAVKYHKCRECSREAIYFTCKAAKDHYLATTICERCAGITY
jgi:hypothetical protein